MNGPDVGPDFTYPDEPFLERPHGFIFEVPVGGVQSNRVPIMHAGRFPHEAAAFSPGRGSCISPRTTSRSRRASTAIYRRTTRWWTATSKMAGRSRCSRSSASTGRTSRQGQTTGATYPVEWVEIPPFPNRPQFTVRAENSLRPRTNDQALTFVGTQGRARVPPGSPGSRAPSSPGTSLLHVHPGRRRGGDRPRADRRIRERNGSGVVVRSRGLDPHLPIPSAVGAARLPRQHHRQERPGHDPPLRGRCGTNFIRGLTRDGRAVRHRPQPADEKHNRARRGSARSSRGPRSARAPTLST